MFRRLPVSRLAVMAPVTALFLAGCGGYDTIVDDADSSDGSVEHAPTLDGSKTDASLDGARADVSSSADARPSDADSASIDADATTAADGPSSHDAGATGTREPTPRRAPSSTLASRPMRGATRTRASSLMREPTPRRARLATQASMPMRAARPTRAARRTRASRLTREPTARRAPSSMRVWTSKPRSPMAPRLSPF